MVSYYAQSGSPPLLLLPLLSTEDNHIDYKKLMRFKEFSKINVKNVIILAKKYHKAVKVVGNIDSALVTISMGLSVAGVGILSTVIAVPAVIAMETTALGAGFLGIIGSQFNKMLMRKAEKHEKIKLLRRLNSIR